MSTIFVVWCLYVLFPSFVSPSLRTHWCWRYRWAHLDGANLKDLFFKEAPQEDVSRMGVFFHGWWAYKYTWNLCMSSKFLGLQPSNTKAQNRIKTGGHLNNTMALQMGNWGHFTTISGVKPLLLSHRGPLCTYTLHDYMWIHIFWIMRYIYIYIIYNKTKHTRSLYSVSLCTFVILTSKTPFAVSVLVYVASSWWRITHRTGPFTKSKSGGIVLSREFHSFNFNFMLFHSIPCPYPFNWSYCWWKKSCTSWYAEYHIYTCFIVFHR